MKYTLIEFKRKFRAANDDVLALSAHRLIQVQPVKEHSQYFNDLDVYVDEALKQEMKSVLGNLRLQRLSNRKIRRVA